MSIFFISDLHLEETRPDITAAFLDFLSVEAAHGEALYILGDFFQVWIGDDDDTPLNDTVARALRSLADKGVAIYFMPGNRDFLVTRTFCERIGATLLADPTVINLAGQPVVLMHGDSLCTSDRGYMLFRKLVRNNWIQRFFLSLDITIRSRIANRLRRSSQQRNQQKSMSIMDVTPGAVAQVLAENHSCHLIHGHTHRPAVHSLEINGRPARRTVLGAWHDARWFVRFSHGEFDLITQPLTSDAG